MVKKYDPEKIRRQYIILKIINLPVCIFAFCLFFDYFLPEKEYLQTIENSYLHYGGKRRGTPIRVLSTTDFKFEVWLNSYHVFKPNETVTIVTTPILHTPKFISKDNAIRHKLPFGIYAYFMLFPFFLLLLSAMAVFVTDRYLSIMAGSIAIMIGILVFYMRYLFWLFI